LSQTRSLEDRLQVLEDIEAIRSLHNTYLGCINKGWNGHDFDPDGLRNVFADDIVWGPDSAGSDGGASRGVDAVIQLIGGMSAAFDFVMHGIQNINIDVDGDAARGTQMMWVATRQAGRRDVMYVSVSRGYVRTADGWRISNLDLQVAGTLLRSPVGF
jgi:hypothetical protein